MSEVNPTPATSEATPLQYAPPARGVGRGRFALVLAGGLVTSVAAAVGVYLLQRFGHQDPFSYHGFIVLPIGSTLMAIVAGSGYVVAAHLAHVRPGRTAGAAIAVLMILAYVLCLYAGYGPFHWVNGRTGVPVTFFEYFHDRSVGWVWRLGGETYHLGVAGYLYRAIDVIVFAGVGLFAAGVGRRVPYCDLCHTYLTRRRLATFPAALPYRRLSGLSSDDLAGYRADQREHAQAAVNQADRLMTAAAAGDVDGVRTAVAAARPDRRSTDRLPARVHLNLVACPVCRASTLSTVLKVGKTNRRLRTDAVSGEFADLR